jgi:hypothetical protein
MLMVLQRQIGGLGGQAIPSSALKSLLGALAAGLAANWAAQGAASALSVAVTEPSWFAGVTITRVIVVGAGGLAGVGTFIIAAFLLQIREAKSLGKLLRRRRG